MPRVTYKPTRKGMMAAQLALTQRQIELAHGQLDAIARVERLLEQWAAVVSGMTVTAGPADGATAPDPAQDAITRRCREAVAQSRGYRHGKPKKAPARSDKYRGCC